MSADNLYKPVQVYFPMSINDTMIFSFNSNGIKFRDYCTFVQALLYF